MNQEEEREKPAACLLSVKALRQQRSVLASEFGLDELLPFARSQNLLRIRVTRSLFHIIVLERNGSQPSSSFLLSSSEVHHLEVVHHAPCPGSPSG